MKTLIVLSYQWAGEYPVVEIEHTYNTHQDAAWAVLKAVSRLLEEENKEVKEIYDRVDVPPFYWEFMFEVLRSPNCPEIPGVSVVRFTSNSSRNDVKAVIVSDERFE